MRRTLLIPVVLALAVGAAVLLIRRRPDPAEKSDRPPSLHAPEESAASPNEGPAPAKAPDLPAVPPDPKLDLRSLFDRLLEALRSGDRDRIREALAMLEGILIPDPVPDEENAALVYQKAFEKLVEFTDDEHDAFGDLAEGKPLTAEQQAALRKLLERNRDAIALLREATSRAKCRFPIDYTEGVSAQLPHISPMIRASKLLLVASLLAGPGGGESVAQASWRLAEAMANEPILVSQLVRSVCHTHSAGALQAEWKTMSTPESLRGLIQKIQPEQIRSGLERSLIFELYAGTKLIIDDKVPNAFFALTGAEKPEGPLATQALADYADTLHEYASLAGRPYYEVKDKLAELERVKTEGAPWYSVYSRQLLPALTRTAARQAETEASFGATQVAAAVELYRQQEGAYPSTLEDLRSILPEPPRDPFTGKSFVYRREGSGFLVYSLGTDGADGGGSSERDVVFRSPR